MNKSSVPLAFHPFWNAGIPAITNKTPWRSAFQTEVYKGEKPSYRFNRHLELLGYQKNTQKMLTACLEEFLYRMKQHGVTILKSVTRCHIESYRQYLSQRPSQKTKETLSSSMINTHLYALRLFFEYCQQAGEITKDPMSSLTFPKPENGIREILTPSEIERLYKNTISPLERALLDVLYGCGLRTSEAINLNRSDLHFKARKLYVREGKGKKRREVPFTKMVANSLEEYYYNERLENLKSGKTEQEAFFVGQTGERIKYQFLWWHFRKLVRTAEINKNVSPHSLRHSIATHLLESGMGIEYVRDFLGHAQLETTQIYTRVNSKIVL